MPSEIGCTVARAARGIGEPIGGVACTTRERQRQEKRAAVKGSEPPPACAPRCVSVWIPAGTDPIAVCIAAAVTVIGAVVRSTGRSRPHRRRTISTIGVIPSRVARYRATGATGNWVTRTTGTTCNWMSGAPWAARDGMCRTHAASVKPTTSSVKAATVKATTSASEPAAAAPTGERVIRDEAGAD